MSCNRLFVSFIIVLVTSQESRGFTVARGKDYRSPTDISIKDVPIAEPSCEELKAMWRFSKRQSRAAEITNEIPTYPDPFNYNVWEPYYPRSRSMGGMPLGRFGTRPIYGRVVHKAPRRLQDLAERTRAFEEVARMYGTVQRGAEPRRRVTAFRLGGGHLPSSGLTPQSGSFQHLKELIRTERARELQQQRMVEEAAARAAALKDLSGSAHKTESSLRDVNYYDTNEREEHDDDLVGGSEGIIAFPDLMAPAIRPPDMDEVRYVPDHSYFRERSKTQGAPLFDSSSFDNDYTGFLR